MNYKTLVLHFERSIFQTFWKDDCCAKFLFFELEMSNFGSLLIFLTQFNCAKLENHLLRKLFKQRAACIYNYHICVLWYLIYLILYPKNLRQDETIYPDVFQVISARQSVVFKITMAVYAKSVEAKDDLRLELVKEWVVMIRSSFSQIFAYIPHIRQNHLFTQL